MKKKLEKPQLSSTELGYLSLEREIAIHSGLAAIRREVDVAQDRIDQYTVRMKRFRDRSLAFHKFLYVLTSFGFTVLITLTILNLTQ